MDVLLVVLMAKKGTSRTYWNLSLPSRNKAGMSVVESHLHGWFAATASLPPGTEEIAARRGDLLTNLGGSFVTRRAKDAATTGSAYFGQETGTGKMSPGSQERGRASQWRQTWDLFKLPRMAARRNVCQIAESVKADCWVRG